MSLYTYYINIEVTFSSCSRTLTFTSQNDRIGTINTGILANASHVADVHFCQIPDGVEEVIGQISRDGVHRATGHRHRARPGGARRVAHGTRTWAVAGFGSRSNVGTGAQGTGGHLDTAGQEWTLADTGGQVWTLADTGGQVWTLTDTGGRV